MDNEGNKGRMTRYIGLVILLFVIFIAFRQGSLIPEQWQFIVALLSSALFTAVDYAMSKKND